MEETLKFKKYSGAGNDFIMINNFEKKLNLDYSMLAKTLCKRGLSIGADGLITIEPSDIADFKMRIFNSDGSEAEMCGNGGRCISMFAYREGIVGKKMKFETLAGIHESEILDDLVKLKMIPPKNYEKYEINYNNNTYTGFLIDTGVPHFVIFYYPKGNIKEIGSFFRYHDYFKPNGTNVDFVKIKDSNSIEIRTYERGVEDETLACGTGSAASALISMLERGLNQRINVITKSGIILTIEAKIENRNIEYYYLIGNAEWIYDGILSPQLYEKVKKI